MTKHSEVNTRPTVLTEKQEAAWNTKLSGSQNSTVKTKLDKNI